jgi:hypothetical protein
MDATSVSAAGEGWADRRKHKNHDSQKIESLKLQNQQNKILKTFIQICFHEIDLEIVHRKIVFLLFEISGKPLASSSLCAPFAMREVHI